MDKRTDDGISPYLTLSRREWAALREDTPMTLTSDEVTRVRSLHDRLDMKEVEDIYLPVSRLLSLYVAAAQRLFIVQQHFLGTAEAKVPYIIGVAGSVAVGKSTTARVLQALLARWPNVPKVDLVTTDGFLLPNAILEREGLMEKKGFPESYDLPALLRFLADVKAGRRPVRAPIYSHLVYDVVPNQWVEVDLRHVRPAREQCLQHAGRGRFADRDRARDADDIGHLAVADAEKLALRPVEPIGRIDIDRQQARQRQIDLLDLFEIEPVVHRAQPRDLAGFERHRHVVAQRRPFRPRVGAVGRQAVVGALFHRQVHSRALEAFSSRPDFLVRDSRSCSTSAKVTSREWSRTRR